MLLIIQKETTYIPNRLNDMQKVNEDNARASTLLQ